MPLSDPYAFQLAGFNEGDVDEILADLDYLHRNSRWTHRRDQVERMIVESPVILLDFLRSVRPDVVRSAMIPRRVKDAVRTTSGRTLRRKSSRITGDSTIMRSTWSLRCVQRELRCR